MRSLPVAVRLTRFAAVFCVFCFVRGLREWRGNRRLLFLDLRLDKGSWFFLSWPDRFSGEGPQAWPGGQHHGHHAAFEARLALHLGRVSQLLGDPLEEAGAQFGAGHLAAAEAQTDADLVAFAEQFSELAELDLQIVAADLGFHAQEADFGGLLSAAGLALTLGLPVLVLAIVHNPADRGVGTGRDLDQVQIALPRDAQGFASGHDAQLGPILVNEADFPSADALVHPELSFDLSLTSRTAKKIDASASRSADQGRALALVV